MNKENASYLVRGALLGGAGGSFGAAALDMSHGDMESAKYHMIYGVFLSVPLLPSLFELADYISDTFSKRKARKAKKAEGKE